MNLKSFNIILILLLIFNCSSQQKNSSKPLIIVSIAPLLEFAEKIGGDKIQTSLMVPDGASPHTYEPKPGQLVEVSKARIYVKVGTPIEFEINWLDKLLAMNKNMLVIDASQSIRLITENHEHRHSNQIHKQNVDPHIWLSPQNAKIMVENIYKGIVKVDTINQKYYEQNKNLYLSKLDSLDEEIRSALALKKTRKFMVYHPSWGYFADQYQLQQISVEEEGKEPTAKGIQNLIEQARRDSINVIFVSPQFNMMNAKQIAREIGGRIISVNPMEKDYISNLKRVARILKETMK